MLACAGAGSSELRLDGVANGLALGQCEAPNACGLIDRDGRWVLAPEQAQVPDRCDRACVVRGKSREVLLVDVVASPVRVTRVDAQAASEVAEGLVVIWPAGRKEPGRVVRLDGSEVTSGVRSAEFPLVDPRRASAPWSPGPGPGAQFAFRDGLAPICTDRCGYLRPDGSFAFTIDGSRPAHFSQGLSVVAGVAWRPDGTRLETSAPLMTPFSDGFAWGWANLREGPDGEVGDWVVIDATGAVRANLGASIRDPLLFTDGAAVALVEATGAPGLIRPDGTVIAAPQGTRKLWSVFGGRALFSDGSTAGYLDADGEIAIAPALAPPADGASAAHLHFSEGLAVARPADAPTLAGYLRPDGSWAIPPTFLDARPFVDGVANVRTEAGWRWIRPDGSPLR